MKRKFLIFLLTAVSTICLAVCLTACGTSSGGSNSGLSGGTEQSGTGGGETEGSGNAEGNVPTVHIHNCTHTAEVEATCTADGNIEYWYCSGCGKYFSDESCTNEITTSVTIFAMGHDATHIRYNATTCTDDGNIEYWHCSVCGKYYSDADATAEITQSETVVAATGHKLTHTEAVSATCTTDGNIEYWYCSECGKYYSNEEAKTEITQDDTVSAATGHKYDSNDVCTVCGTHKPTEGLIYTYVSYIHNIGGYSVSVGTATNTEIYIPNTYDDGTNGTYPVTAIDSYAFNSCTSLTSITIPDNVTSIGKYAFGNCTSLTSITIPDNVTSIGEYAFGNCTSLTSITIPDSVTTIGKGVFYNCTSLENVTIPDGVTTIGSSAFKGCTSLTSIIIPDSVTSIGSSAFSSCRSLTSITIPDSITFIGGDAFYNTAYYIDSDNWENNVLYIENYLIKAKTDISGEYSIKEGTTIIAGSAFSSLVSLKSITIPDSVTSIGSSAFYCCTSLTSITIPESVTSIGTYAFHNCTALTEIYYNAIAMDDLSSGNFVFSNAGQSGDGISVTIGAKVTSIPAYIFYPYSLSDYAPNITSVVFEDNSVCKSIGSYAFYGCSSLTSITIPESITTIDAGTFSGCSSLESITLPFVGSSANATSASSSTLFGYIFGTTEYDGSSAITQYYSSDSYTIYYIPATLTNVTITGGNILYGAFSDCISIESVTIGGNVTSIGDSAFSGCSGLVSITIPFVGSSANATNASSSTLFGYIFGTTEYDGGTAITQYYSRDGYTTYYIPASLINVTITDSNILYGAFSYCTTLKSVTIGNNITSIDENAFIDCTSLESVYITDLEAWCKISFSYFYANPMYYANYLYLNGKIISGEIVLSDTITTIPYGTFKNSNISSITIPESVTSIGSAAFCYCYFLISVTIPDSVTSIDYTAFWYCTSIKNVYYSGTASQWASIAFSDAASNPLCYNNGNLYLDGTLATDITIEGITAINDCAFHSYSSLKSVTIGSDVTSIGMAAFYWCTSLESVTIGSDVTSIGFNAFYWCTSLKSVTIGDNVEIINDYAFFNCISLTNVTIPDGVSSIGSYAFYSCTSLANVTLGNNLTYIGEEAFRSCSSLESITIPDSVTHIGTYAFAGCSSLESVIIGIGITSINDDTFRDCNSLASVYYNGTAEEWSEITIGADNDCLTSATIYYYSEETPAESGNYWHYVDGEIVV